MSRKTTVTAEINNQVHEHYEQVRDDKAELPIPDLVNPVSEELLEKIFGERVKVVHDRM